MLDIIKETVANDNSVAESKKVANGSPVAKTETSLDVQEDNEILSTNSVDTSLKTEVADVKIANDNAPVLPYPPNDPNSTALTLPEQEELYIDIEAISQKFNLPKEQLEMMCANNSKAIYIPTDLTKLQQFICIQKGLCQTAEGLSKLTKLPKEAQKFFLQKAQLFAYIWLKSEVQLGRKIQTIATRQGKRTDLQDATVNKNKQKKSKKKETSAEQAFESKTTSRQKRPFKEFFNDIRTKADILDQDYNLSYSQARDLVRLNDDVVEKEMKYAIANNEIPSRRHALSFLFKESIKVEKECDDAFELNTIFSSVSHNSLLGRITQEDVHYCSLFACIGSGEYYLKDRGFKCVLANEFDPDRAEYFSLKMAEKGEQNCKMIQGRFQDCFDELVQEFKNRQCELLLVSPPCQVFCSQRGKNFLQDERLDLIVYVIEFIKETKPQYIVIENAQQFLNFSMPKDNSKDGEPAKNLRKALNGRTIGQYIKDELISEGFDVNFANEDSCFYGCPQSRVRSIVLASKTGVWPFPKKDDYAVLPWEIIGNMPSLEPGEGKGFYDTAPKLSNNPEQAEEIYNALIHTPPGGCTADNLPEYQISGFGFFGAKCARNSWNKPWSTIEGGSNNALGLRTIHPGRLKADGTYSDPRCCTFRETFLLNTLPADYIVPEKFQTPEKEKFVWTVMGEIFLPRMLERIMETIPLPHRQSLINIEDKNEEVA